MKKIAIVILLFIVQFTSNAGYVLALEASQAAVLSTENGDLIAGLEETNSQEGIESVTSDPVLAPLITENDEITPTLAPKFKVDVTSDSSALVRKIKRLRRLNRTSFTMQEKIRLIVDNATEGNIRAKVYDSKGKEVDLSIQAVLSDNATVLSILPTDHFTPGKYTVKVLEGKEEISEQDFTWGVLAINTNKATYAPKEKATIAIGVLDENGLMVCNASVELRIRNKELGEEDILSTKNGKITVNPECFKKSYTERPDYEAQYTVGGIGTYQMSLSAETKNGSYAIEDSFTVSGSVPFVVERQSATRIYPAEAYPVKLSVTAQKDFSGTITETVPNTFAVDSLKDTVAYAQVRSISASSLTKEEVLGASVKLSMPFKSEHTVSSGFSDELLDEGLKKLYFDYGLAGHDGIDFDMPSGTPILASDDGQVVLAKENSDYGTTVVIQHTWGKSYYGHLRSFDVTVGQKVKRGEQIALSGNSGLSTGAHLHFGLKPNEHDTQNGFYGKVDPAPFLGLSANARVLAAATSNLESPKKVLTWNVDLKKGETVTLGYKYKAPELSPQFYTAGPLRFFEKEGGSVFEEARVWQIAVDAVVVSTGITETEAQFGGLQRKVAYVNSNWYAFYNDGTDVWYKKSSDGATWETAVDMDSGDADNYNPSIGVSGNIIHVFWLDESGDQVEGRQINTASSDAQGTLCQLTSPGAFTVSTYMVTLASVSTTAALVAYSDTSSGTIEDVYSITTLNGTCAGNTTSVKLGNMPFGTQGSGLADSDRPVMVPLTATTGMMISQDGDLSSSVFNNSTISEWQQQNQTIGAVADDTYSVTTDGTNVWVLSKSGTTATNFYHYPKASTGIVETSTAVDADIGAAAADTQDSEIDMDCISATDCKIVFTDVADTAAPALVFIDCDNADCSTKTTTIIDSDVGDATHGGNPKITCPSATNCKIVYGDMAVAAPDAVFIDCGDATCSGTSGTCTSGTRTCAIVDTDLGAADTEFYGDVFCPSDVSNDTDCKFIFYNSVDETNDAVWFADCSNASCGTRDALTSIHADMNDDAADAQAPMSLYCNASADCQVLFHDAVNGDLTLRDCSNSSCSTANATTDIDIDVGANAAAAQSVSVANAIDCSAGATDCKILYADGSQNEVNFVDCSAAGCTASTITKLDDTAGGIMGHQVSLYCVATADCKGTFVATTTGSAEDVYMFDCDSATCDSGSVVDLGDPPFMSVIDCVGGSTDCKLAYYDIVVNGTDIPIRFADCTNENCAPEWESLTAPWTGQTNVTSVSLQYDSTNTDLYASIIKDASEQVYYKTTDATTISWSSETSYAFTAGDLGHVSSPLTGAGVSNVGAIVRQGSNIEFKMTVPAVLRQAAYRWHSNIDSADVVMVKSNPTPENDAAHAMAVDTTGGYVYIAGNDQTPGNYEWRIEKRSTTDGSLVTSFGTNGVVQSNPSSGIDSIEAIVIDVTNGYLYVGGYDSSTVNNQWRIEKRKLSNGNLCTAAECGTGFDTDGVYTYNPSSNDDQLQALALDSTGSSLYVGGYDEISNAQWRLGKFNTSDGSIDTGFGVSGWAVSDNGTGGHQIRALRVDSSGGYVYSGGYGFNGTSDRWRMEKRKASNGNLCTAAECGTEFGTAGVVLSDPTANHDQLYSMDIDVTGGYMYLGGRDDPTSGNTEWRIEKRKLSNGALCTAVECGTLFGTAGVITTNPSSGNDEVYAITVDTTNGAIYAAGFDYTLTSKTQMRLEKRLATTGALVAGFGTSGVVTYNSGGTVITDINRYRSVYVDTTNSVVYVAGHDAEFESLQLHLEKRNISDGTFAWGAGLAAQDTFATLTSDGAAFRLRLLLDVSASPLLASEHNYKLQYAAKSGTCDTSFSDETYADINTSSTPIQFKDNLTPSDGASTSAQTTLDPTYSGHTNVREAYEEQNTFTNNIATIPSGQAGLWDFSLYDASAPADTSYCLRVVKSDNSLLDFYTAIPEVRTMSASGGTLDQLMRHGRWFNSSGVIQPFTF